MAEALEMKNKNLTVKKGENCKIYKYSLFDRLKIVESNIFWKWADIISCKIKFFAKIYDKSISKEYIREIQKFDISKAKNILHIGCGAYPITAVTLSEYNGGKITGIDRNSVAVEWAKEIINEKSLSDRVTIDRGDGASYPVDQFDTIIISSCSVPKLNILEHLFENAKSNCKIIVREHYHASRLVDNFINCYDDVELVETMDNSPTPTSRWISYCLVKK